jgi:hypothetical protein
MDCTAHQGTAPERGGAYVVRWLIALSSLLLAAGCDCKQVVCYYPNKTLVKCWNQPVVIFSSPQTATCAAHGDHKTCCSQHFGGDPASYHAQEVGAPSENICCDKDKNEDLCCQEHDKDSKQFKLSQLPTPELSYAGLDGLVDFGTSILRVEVPSEGDYFETRLKGRIAISGGICTATQKECPLQVLFVELKPALDPLPLQTAKKKSVSGVLVRNVNTWTGRRQMNDGAIVMDTTNRLGLQGTLDGTEYAAVLDPTPWFKGSMHYNAIRLTASGPRTNNLIKIFGKFSSGDIQATLTINIWATRCQPVIHPSAQCLPDIEAGFPGRLELTSTYERLESMQSSQDLCDTLMVSDPTTVCTAGGDAEFPTFTCKKQPLPPAATPAEVASQLEFRWRDATGYELGDAPAETLQWMPVFPVTLTVENKWGRRVDAQVMQASQSATCPKAMEYLTNRMGSNYQSLNLAQADPALCQSRCDEEAQCKAWTYVKPGFQGPKARCWLKHDVPLARPDACCVSAVKGMEYATDRPGSNYKSFELAEADAAPCQASCAAEAGCRAWTYVKPGVQGPKARCWLKQGVPTARSSGCCISGVK